MEANVPGFNSVCAFSGRRCSRRQQGAYVDFVNIEDLLAQSSKMLIWVGFACVYSYRFVYTPRIAVEITDDLE